MFEVFLIWSPRIPWWLNLFANTLWKRLKSSSDCMYRISSINYNIALNVRLALRNYAYPQRPRSRFPNVTKLGWSWLNVWWADSLMLGSGILYLPPNPPHDGSSHQGTTPESRELWSSPATMVSSYARRSVHDVERETGPEKFTRSWTSVFRVPLSESNQGGELKIGPIQCSINMAQTTPQISWVVVLVDVSVERLPLWLYQRIFSQWQIPTPQVGYDKYGMTCGPPPLPWFFHHSFTCLVEQSVCKCISFARDWLHI